MQHFLLAGFVFACTLGAQPKPGAGSIEGHVFNSLTGAPARKAAVILTTLQIRLVADTDAEGWFQFTGLPAGSYRLSASHSGFFDRSARRPIALGPDDHVTNAEIRLRPQGVITGHVLDEDGDPVADARVAVFKQVYRDGGKQWERLDINALTSDAGEYRYPSLKPGRYLVQAWNPRPTAVDNRYGDRDLPDKPGKVYVPAYYPSAPDIQAASPVEVGVGTEVRGTDIHLFKLAIPPYFHVRGKVTGVQDPHTVIKVSLHPADDAAYGESVTTQAPDYAFDVSVPSGRYTIFAYVSSGGPEVYATGGVTVMGNVADVALAMSPAPELTGRISLAESGSQINLQGVKVTLSRIPTYPGVPGVRAEAAGRLIFSKPVPPGHYAIDVRSIPDNCFVQKVRLGGQEVSADDFRIFTSTELEVILSNRAGKIAGSASDGDGKPFPNASVTLIPADGKPRPQKQSLDDDGNFNFTSLRPGTYKLFAWEEVDDSVWQDPDFRKKYENRATEVIVAPAETQRAQLRVIEAEEMK